MTCRAKFRCRTVRVSNGQGHVRLVAVRTIRLCHRFGVRFMTGDTLRNITVSISMTEIARKGRMLAWAGNHLIVGTSVTGNADRFEFSSKRDIEGLVRVMATKAVVNLVMSFVRMTVATFGNIVCDSRTVSFVTGLAIDFRLVGSPIGSNLGRLLAVTFDTIVNRQYGLLC